MRASSLITDVVKKTICKKTEVPGMEKPSYLPSCLQQCADMCGVRCRRKCWVQHPEVCNKDCKKPCKVHHHCSRGKLGDMFLFCPSGAVGNVGVEPILGYLKFETTDVPTFGKGVAFTRVDKIETKMPESEFSDRFKREFTTYAEHIVPSWYLRSAVQSPLICHF